MSALLHDVDYDLYKYNIIYITTSYVNIVNNISVYMIRVVYNNVAVICVKAGPDSQTMS